MLLVPIKAKESEFYFYSDPAETNSAKELSSANNKTEKDNTKKSKSFIQRFTAFLLGTALQPSEE